MCGRIIFEILLFSVFAVRIPSLFQEVGHFLGFYTLGSGRELALLSKNKGDEPWVYIEHYIKN